MNGIYARHSRGGGVVVHGCTVNGAKDANPVKKNR